MSLMERGIWMITSREVVLVVVDKDDEDEDDKSTGCPGQAWGRPNGVAIPSSNLCTAEHTCYKHASDYFHLKLPWSTSKYLKVFSSTNLCFFQIVISALPSTLRVPKVLENSNLYVKSLSCKFACYYILLTVLLSYKYHSSSTSSTSSGIVWPAGIIW